MKEVNLPETYAVKHKDFETRLASRSGGIFTALSDHVLDKGGVVYGCVLTDDFDAMHIRADNKEDRNKMRGSKYIQSNMGEMLSEIRKDLESGKEVLFSGTSCQVAGLKSYVGDKYTGLLCVDIVCHGVPSPLVWKKYIEWQRVRHKGRIKSVDFRNKKDFGWGNHVETIILEKNGWESIVVNSKIFTTLFYNHAILRPSCYKCPYKAVMHPGDISIADYWGVDVAAPGFNDDKGVSLVLINNEAGMNAFNQVKQHVDWKKTRIEDSMQPPFIAPFDAPITRNKFWVDFQKDSFGVIARKYGNYSWCKEKIVFLGRKVKRLLLRNK